MFDASSSESPRGSSLQCLEMFGASSSKNPRRSFNQVSLGILTSSSESPRRSFVILLSQLGESFPARTEAPCGTGGTVASHRTCARRAQRASWPWRRLPRGRAAAAQELRRAERRRPERSREPPIRVHNKRRRFGPGHCDLSRRK